MTSSLSGLEELRFSSKYRTIRTMCVHVQCTYIPSYSVTRRPISLSRISPRCTACIYVERLYCKRPIQFWKTPDTALYSTYVSTLCVYKTERPLYLWLITSVEGRHQCLRVSRNHNQLILFFITKIEFDFLTGFSLLKPYSD
jgi:hypothetical protein